VAAGQVQREEAPQTLREAHDFVHRLRPAPDADSAAWRLFHQQSARVYEHVADIDRGHHHEALYWFGYEQRKAAEFADKLAKEATATR
jgi:hypothetical protein